MIARPALACGLLSCLAVAVPASAASVSYYLDQSNDLPDGTNYAQVTIADSITYAGDIEFTVEVFSSAFPQPLSNFGMQTFYFNYDNSLTVEAGNMVDIDPSDWDINNDKNAGGGFGKFEFEFMGDGSSRTELLTFRITGVAGDTPQSYAMLSTGFLNPASTEYFAAHIAGYDGGVTGNTSGKFAGSTLVPVPGALWLFAPTLALLGWLRRR